MLSAEVAGPGFINIRVSDAALSARADAVRVDAMAGGEKAAAPERIVLDFGGPNVAKPMHVGHLRSAVIGDTLQRIFRFAGDDVISDTHLGDWGLQMGHLITELQDEQPDLVYFDASFEGPYPAEPPVTMDDLARLYPQASNKAKADEARNERSQKAVAEMQAGRAGYRALLTQFINVSVPLKQDYVSQRLVDLWKGEAMLMARPEPIERFKAAGLAVESDGAWIVPLAREGGISRSRRTGRSSTRTRCRRPAHSAAARAITTDCDDPRPGRAYGLGAGPVVYVVDQRQAQHSCRCSARRRNWPDAEDRLEHIGFGTVNGADGKPFKTREGACCGWRT